MGAFQDLNSQTSDRSVFDINRFQPVSRFVWDEKYHLKNFQGESVDGNMRGMYERVARELSQLESEELRQECYEAFLWAFENGAIAGGRIMANAGAGAYKPVTSTINCTLSGTIPDSLRGIMNRQIDASITLQAGCGIGYEFSTLRPKGAFVAGAGATTSGPLSFMDGYDSYCFTISSAGGRRGAQMATFDCQHPDIIDFIKAKRMKGRFRHFNLSVLIVDAFVEAVKNDEDWYLVFPLSKKEMEQTGVDLNDPSQVYWREWPLHDNDYLINEENQVACKIYETIKARNLWSMIMSSTYDFSDPGFILIDRVNQMNNNWWCENIRATNPCGEQPLPPWGACLLGSINLTAFVINPFTPMSKFDYERYRKVTAVFTRMLDNVVEINGLPLEQQQEEIRRKRRHGMGYLGLGSAMVMMGLTYGDEESLAFTDKVSKELALEGWRQGIELAKEKGAAPIMDEEFTVTKSMLIKRPAMVEDGYKVGDRVKGKVLHIKYSEYMAKIREELGVEWEEEALEHGLRFTHHSSLAPTGTIALALANNASNGIEPTFAHECTRNIIIPGRNSKADFKVFSAELLAYRKLIDGNASAKTQGDKLRLPKEFIGAGDIAPENHIKVQAAAQEWIDSSISKTTNVPTNCDYSEFEKIYMQAIDSGLKGCTTFRFNPEVHGGVIVQDEDLANTEYAFTLEDGTEVKARGNDYIKYEGEFVLASNLFDAHKDGYYGRF